MPHIRIITSYHAAYANPLRAKPGAELTAGRRDEDWPGWIWCTDPAGKGAWIPEAYLDMHDGKCILKREYDPTELSVEPGDVLTAEVEESGWLWCVTATGKHGWIPAIHAEKLGA